MITGVQILRLAIWLLAIPLCVGTLFLPVDKKSRKVILAWVSGQTLLWAVFQLICVPVILKEGSYIRVQQLYLVAVAVLLSASGIRLFLTRRKGGMSLKLVRNGGEYKSSVLILWGIFGALLLFQLIQAARMTYADGDDAFYVAVSTITESSDSLYMKLPYTGEGTLLDARHGLAPFPIWITFLARISGIRAVSVAHVAAPLALIAMTYGVFYLIGNRLCGNKPERLPLFLIFTEILTLFGDYSYYSVENFMIARSRQGKAALGSIIIPVLFFLLMLLMEFLQNNRKIPLLYWVLLLSAMTAGSLMSTMGAMLCCMLAGIAALCGAVCYRKWKFLLWTAAGCVPCGFYALLYLWLD